MDRAHAESRLKRYFAERDDVIVAYLFGSVARDAARDDSDVDVAVLLSAMPEDPYDRSGSNIVAELTSRLGVDVDVVVLNHAPVDLIHRVLRDDCILAEHDRSRRIAFEVDARNRYFDLLPFIRRYRRQEGSSPEVPA